MTYGTSIEMVVENEEFVSAAEYLARRERGEINPDDVRIVQPDVKTGRLGGFMIRLKTPRYTHSLPDMRKAFSYGY